MAQSIVTLSCGCFFQGKEFFVDPACREHDADDDEPTACDTCGQVFPILELDCKPTINSRLRRIRAREGQLVMLRRAADLGFDFDRLECRRCYGPGFIAVEV